MDKKQRETLQYVAQLMFIEGGQAQKEIAARLGVSEQTICRWAKAGQWDALVGSAQLFAANCCRTIANYIDDGFARQMREALGRRQAGPTTDKTTL